MEASSAGWQTSAFEARTTAFAVRVSSPAIIVTVPYSIARRSVGGQGYRATDRNSSVLLFHFLYRREPAEPVALDAGYSSLLFEAKRRSDCLGSDAAVSGSAIFSRSG